MTLQDWGALGELIGGVAIIVSLIYVGLQVRQGTHATRAATSQAFTDQYISVLPPLREPGFAEIFWRGLRGLHNLQGSEKVVFMSFIATFLRIFEAFYFQEKDGAFDTRLFGGWSNTFIDLFTYEGPREVLEIRNHWYSAQFVEYLQDRIAKAAPKDMYSKAAT
jgi:hypothetical protein